MDDKTLMPASGPTLQRTFLYREDWLLFGLLVRHGLVEPQTWSQLAAAQSAHEEKPSLLRLLSTSSELTAEEQRNMQELLDLLAKPELRGKLPGNLPQMATIIERTHSATRPAGDSDTKQVAPATLVDDHGHAGAAVTVPATQAATASPRSQTLLASSSFASMGSLTEDELQRIAKARTKAPLVGVTIAGHVILDRLGSGGQGDVFLAKQLSLNRYVALKKLEVAGHELSDTFIDAFRREAQTLGGINHARIVKVFEIFQVEEGAFFTMEHINGKTIKDLVKESNGGLPVEVGANIACQALSALGRTAEGGLIHRDIKPANMLLDENGDLKIVDFGLAAAQASMTRDTGGFAGTPHFASPEQCAGKALTPASDQYSLGVTLFYALTGRAPFESKKLTDLLEQHINHPPPLASSFNEQLPSAVDKVLNRMLAKNPTDRYATFQDCFDAWEKILRDSSRRTAAGTAQFLGDNLLRFGREQKDRLIKQGSVLAALWLAMALGAILGESSLRHRQMKWVLDGMGTWGSALLTFSLACIAYVAMARRGWLPTVGSLRAWLYTHIATAIPAVLMLLIHSGNFLGTMSPGGTRLKPWLSILMGTALVITAVSGSVGLLIFRELRRNIQVQQLQLRGGGTPDSREAMMMALGAQMLAGWRLVHYPLAVLFVLVSILHILVSIRFSV